MKVEVAYGKIDAARFFDCSRCAGSGEAETYFQSGEFATCPRCHGSGSDPSPQSYAYTAPDDVEVGEHLVVPPTRYKGEQVATVVRLGSDYTGSVATARRTA